MKTIEDFRRRKIEYLQFVIKCPERCGSIDQELGMWLSDMLFLDERIGTWEKEKKRLEKMGRFSVFGSRGPFAWHLPRPLRKEFERPLQMECVSVYAEVLWRLGYLTVERVLSPGEWKELRDSLQLLTRGDWHAAEVEARFGKPSLVINGGSQVRRCQCYASADKEVPWICFDYEFMLEGYGTVAASRGAEEQEEVITIDEKPWHEHPDYTEGKPLLRNVRSAGGMFEKGLVVTGYGQRIGMNPFGMKAR